MSAIDEERIRSVARMMREVGIVELDLHPTGDVQRIVLTKDPPDAPEPETSRDPIPEAQAIVDRVEAERLDAEAVARERKAYERMAYAATEGVDGDE